MSRRRPADGADRPAVVAMGASQPGLRRYNERLVIDAIRLSGPLTKAEIARMTRLTPQTATVIVNRLIDEGYLLKQELRRGKVGQPSTPIALNPEGAYSIGVIIGRRALETIMTDFTATVINRTTFSYPWPDREQVFDQIATSVQYLVDSLGVTQRGRLAGVGIAGPRDLHGWETVIGTPPGELANWRGVDIRARVAAETGLPTWLLNDASSACLAEMVLGIARQHRSVLYLYIATFIGGGLVLGGQIQVGAHGNAGALGSMPLQRRDTGVPPQLIEAASLYTLRAALGGDGATYQAAIDGTLPADAPEQAQISAWVDEAARAMAFAIVAGISVVDIEAAVIDGVMHRGLIARLVDAVRAELHRYNDDGLVLPELRPGAVGRDARQRGGAMLPLHARFAPSNSLFLKDESGEDAEFALNID